MHRVYQGFTCSVLLVKLIQAFTCEDEGGYLAIIEADTGEIAAAGEQVGSQEDVGSFVVLDGDHLLLQNIDPL